MAATIQPQDKSAIKAALGSNVEIVAATGAKVYTTCMRPDRWTPQGHEGALVLLKDRALGGLFFRLVSFEVILFERYDYTKDEAKVVWEHEVYFDCEYRIDCEFFHSFESDNNQKVGFLFVSEREADDFARVVYQKSEILQISSNSVSRRSSTIIPKDNHDESIKSSKASEKSETVSGSGGGGGFFGLFRRSREKELSNTKGEDSWKRKSRSLGELTADDIGDPTDFQHLAHIGFNSSTGAFDVQNIPVEWKAIFQKAGVTREQLENRETAGFIADFVKQNVPSGPVRTTSQTTLNKTTPIKKGPPPPPPIKSIKAPPPAPPSRRPLVVGGGGSGTGGGSTNTFPTQNIPQIDSVNSISRVPVVPPITTLSESEDENRKQGEKSSFKLPVDAGRAQLLASIRSAGNISLKHVEREESSSSPAPTTGSEDQSDVMATMLAKALAERNRKLAHSDSDQSDTDW